jgi:hypothetical protein
MASCGDVATMEALAATDLLASISRTSRYALPTSLIYSDCCRIRNIRTVSATATLFIHPEQAGRR